MIKLMYITKCPEIALIAEKAGVDWIFVDMEFIGKDIRQAGLDTVQNHHTIEDVRNIKSVVKKAKVLVRVNPIHDVIGDYPATEEEIEEAIKAGADILMLPFFKKVSEVQRFIRAVQESSIKVGRKIKTCLLVETPEAVVLLDKILDLSGIDMIHLGLNDLHLALGMKFMFELLADGTVDRLCLKIKAKGIPFGFGGIASLRGGMLPGSMVLKEHYRLGSSMVIISRSFCNTDKITDMNEIARIFNAGIAEIRALEKEAEFVARYFIDNRNDVLSRVKSIVLNNN